MVVVGGCWEVPGRSGAALVRCDACWLCLSCASGPSGPTRQQRFSILPLLPCSLEHAVFVCPGAQAVQGAKLDPANVDEVVLVGGASHMPRIRQLLQSVFGGRDIFCRSLSSEDAVVCGAAVQVGCTEVCCMGLLG